MTRGINGIPVKKLTNEPFVYLFPFPALFGEELSFPVPSLFRDKREKKQTVWREKLMREKAMCPTEQNQTHRSSTGESAGKCTDDGESTTAADWISETINGGSLRHVDLHTGTNGWASPPGDLFFLRSKNYLTKRQKSPAGEYLLSPAGVDWLRSSAKLDNVLARPDNRIAHAVKRAH